MPASHAFEEARHGLIRRADLHLEKRRLVAKTSIGRTLHPALLRVVPGARPAEDVVLLRALVGAAAEDGIGDGVFKGAGAAFEAIGALVGVGDGEDVCTMRAD